MRLMAVAVRHMTMTPHYVIFQRQFLPFDVLHVDSTENVSRE